MRKPIVEYVCEYADTRPDRVAIVTKKGEITYAGLAHAVKCYARYLKEIGITEGSRVVVKSSQSIEYVVIYLSVHLIGAAIVAAEKSISDEGLFHIAEAVEANAIINNHPAVTEMGSVIFANSKNIWTDAGEEELSDVTFPGLTDLADIMYTTGTTGASKGVMLTHNALIATAENLICGCEYREDNVLVVPGPLNHANPIRNVYASLINGSTVYILNGMMNVKAFFDALDYPCDKVSCCLPPPFIRMLFQLSQDKISDYADKIDYIVSSTAPYPETDKEHLCRLLPKSRLLNSYGSSESGVLCMYNYLEHPGLENCVGRPTVNSEILIVDDKKNVIQSSKQNTGFLACRSEVNMLGYLNAPEMTRQYMRDGIVYTNDVSYIDVDGFVYIVGRQDDVINVGGLKVAPTEVEAAALAYNGIEECICLGIDDELSGKVLKLLVVMNEEATFDAKEINRFLAGKLEGYKVPHLYEQVKEIAKTYNGKLDRKAYR